MSDPDSNLRPSSMADSEKTATPSVQHAVTDEKKGPVETVLPATAAAVDAAAPIVSTGEKSSRPNSTDGPTPQDDEDDFEYPTKWKLAAITVALCLSVFCMALVSLSIHRRLSPVQLRWYKKR